jgi:rhodanese-related sulfurtransferase
MKRKISKPARRNKFPVWGWAILAVAILAVAGIAVLQALKPATAALPLEITVPQAAQKRSQGAFLLDVREPSEWTQFHVQGATLIPLGELPNRLNEIPQDREVVVICRTGHRSAQGRDILLKAGFAQVTSMAGGMTAWQAQGLQVATGQ